MGQGMEALAAALGQGTEARRHWRRHSGRRCGTGGGAVALAEALWHWRRRCGVRHRGTWWCARTCSRTC